MIYTTTPKKVPTQHLRKTVFGFVFNARSIALLENKNSIIASTFERIFTLPKKEPNISSQPGKRTSGPL